MLHYYKMIINKIFCSSTLNKTLKCMSILEPSRVIMKYEIEIDLHYVACSIVHTHYRLVLHCDFVSTT